MTSSPGTMTDYALSRAQSVAMIRGSAIDNNPSLMLTRTYSVPDVYAYRRLTDPYKPQWSVFTTPLPQYRPYFPYCYYRDSYGPHYSSVNHFWYNKYYRFTPLYKRNIFRNLFSHNYDFDNTNYPSYSRRTYDPFYDPYSRGNLNPYKSHLID